MKRKWIGFATLMIMLLAVTVWADNGLGGGVYQPCTGDNPSGKNNVPVDCSQDIKGVGQVLRYQLGKNVYVGVNLNLETLYLATATGSGFTHPAFGFIRNEISDAAREYFGQYQQNPDALWMDRLSLQYQMIPERRFPSNIVGGVLGVEPVFGKQIIYENGKSPDAKKMGKRLKRFYNKTAANIFFQNKLSFYNQMTKSFVAKYQLDYIQPLERFFGMDMSRERFEVILSPLYYGAEALEVKNLDGSTTFINIMNPVYRAGDGDGWILDALYHEAAHNFLGVAFSNHAKLIKDYEPYLKAINTDARGVVKDSFQSYLGEMLARVVTLVMLEQNHSHEMANRNLNLEISRGWTNLDEYYALVKNAYLTDRSKYPTFDSFLPVILEYIKTKSKGEAYDVRPKPKPHITSEVRKIETVKVVNAKWLGEVKDPDLKPSPAKPNSFMVESQLTLSNNVDLRATLDAFFAEAGWELKLVAAGKPDIQARVYRSKAINGSPYYFWFSIPDIEFSQMVPGVPYQLVAAKPDLKSRWDICEGVVLFRPLEVSK